MLYGSARTKFLIRLFIGVAAVVLGAGFHLLTLFAVGLVVLAVAVIRYGHDQRGGGDDW